MTLNELKNRLLTEKFVVVCGLQIRCGEKYESPGVWGIYEEDGVWYLYDTTDRGEICVLAEGNENDIVRRHIVGGTNCTLISVNLPPRLCRTGTCRRLSAE